MNNIKNKTFFGLNFLNSGKSTTIRFRDSAVRQAIYHLFLTKDMIIAKPNLRSLTQLCLCLTHFLLKAQIFNKERNFMSLHLPPAILK